MVKSAVYLWKLPASRMSARLQRNAPKLALPSKDQWRALFKISFVANKLHQQLIVLQDKYHEAKATKAKKVREGMRVCASLHNALHRIPEVEEEVIDMTEESLAGFESADVAKFCVGEAVIVVEETGVPCSVAAFAEVSRVVMVKSSSGGIAWLYDLEERINGGAGWDGVQVSF